MSNKHTEALLLARCFFSDVRQLPVDEHGKIQATPEYKKAVLANAYRCLYSGYLYEDIKALMENKTGSYYNIEELIKETNPSFKLQSPPQSEGECIEIGHFYYHPLLQQSRSAPSYVLDPETMEMTKKESEPFFLEIKEHFTTRDALMFYYISHEMNPLPGKAALTQMTNLINNYKLDLVLYMIEASAESKAEGETTGASTPAFLPSYLTRAVEMLDSRRLTLKKGGLTHVIPRATYTTPNTQ